jgi:steroid 5-alpha reductase family enzyme
MLTTLLTNLGLTLGLMTLLWLLSLRLRDASIVDIFWGCGFIAVAWSTALQTGVPDLPQLLLPLTATLWGLRLAVYLASRNLGHGEDKRYAAMRAARPDTFWRWSLFAIFWFQALLCWFIALPLQVGLLDPRSADLLGTDVAGLALFVVGFAWEAIADGQLARFKRDPANRGAVMDRGLWRFSRHPNYFGEAVLWWGIWLMAAGAPEARWTAVGPALLTFLLLRVSGVTLLERTIVERRPAYAEYIRRTPAFLPGPRRP